MKVRVTFCLVIAAGMLSISFAAAGADEASLISVITDPDATLQEKSNACRELAQVGTEEAVPALAELLADEELSHRARYALEAIPYPAADEALTAALTEVEGRPLLGVIASAGVRRSEAAVEPLAELLQSEEVEVAHAAAAALGSIGTVDAADALLAALAEAEPRDHLALSEGVFRCAEALAEAGETGRAIDLYDRVLELEPEPRQARLGALRGAVLTRSDEEGLARLEEALNSEEHPVFATAIRLSMELPDEAIGDMLATALPDASTDRQIPIIQALGERGDVDAAPVLHDMTGEDHPTGVRVAALYILTRFAHDPVVDTLEELVLTADGELEETARRCLVGYPGEAADDAILALLEHEDTAAQLTGLDLVTDRNMPQTMDVLLETAADHPNEEMRGAALSNLRQAAGLEELPALLALLADPASDEEADTIESMLLAVCVRLGETVGGELEITEAVYGDLPDGDSADVTQEVAGMVEEGSLSVEASNANFGDPADGVVKQLRVDYVLDGQPGSQTVQEGETLNIGMAAPPEVVEAFRSALAQDPPAEAQRAMLRVLGSIESAGAFELAAEYVEHPEAGAEAREAVVRIAEAIALPSDQLTPVMEQVVELTDDSELADRARELAETGE